MFCYTQTEVFISSLSLSLSSRAPFRCAQLGVRATKLDQHLEEEKQMNSCLRANQTQLQTQLAEEKRRGVENGDKSACVRPVTAETPEPAAATQMGNA